MEFLIDGKLVLSEQLAPFGDSFADGSITTSNGQHTFLVRALTDSGTLLATNTVTATIGSQTPPPRRHRARRAVRSPHTRTPAAPACRPE